MSTGALLVPGNDLDAGFYAGLTAALARRAVRVDVLSRQAIDRREWPAVVAAVRAALGSRETLIGHSLGGVAALLVAAEGPVDLRRIVLIEPIIAPTRALAAALSRGYTRDVIHGDRRVFRNGDALFRRVHDLARFPRAAIDHYLEVRARSDPGVAAALFAALPSLYPLPLGRVRVPALCLRGARSGVFSRVAGGVLRARLPRAREVVLPRTAHWVANEADERAAAAIAAFVRPDGERSCRS